MPKQNSTTVGTSHRTPAKHDILNIILGKIAGSTGTGRPIASRTLYVADLFAGDGAPSAESQKSSPQIITKHINWRFLSARSHALLFERQESTFRALESNAGNIDRARLIHGDSGGFRFTDFNGGPKDAYFVYADPNSIAGLDFECLTQSAPIFTTFVVTMGCNPGGLKRLPRDEREKWYQIKSLAEGMRRHHDCHMYIMNRDASQWSYMAIVPRKWSTDIADAVMRAHGHALTHVAKSTCPDDEWSHVFDHLFLTRGEV